MLVNFHHTRDKRLLASLSNLKDVPQKNDKVVIGDQAYDVYYRVLVQRYNQWLWVVYLVSDPDFPAEEVPFHLS